MWGPLGPSGTTYSSYSAFDGPVSLSFSGGDLRTKNASFTAISYRESSGFLVSGCAPGKTLYLNILDVCFSSDRMLSVRSMLFRSVPISSVNRAFS